MPPNSSSNALAAAGQAMRQQAIQVIKSAIDQADTSPEQRESLKSLLVHSPGAVAQVAGMLWRAQRAQRGAARRPHATADALLAARAAGPSGHPKPLAIVKAVWGWGNRLRAFDGVHALASELGYQLVLVDSPLETPKQASTHLVTAAAARARNKG